MVEPEAAARYGVTPASFSQTRVLAQTSAGTIYIVPGTKGTCVVLLPAASCGDPGTPGEPTIAIFVQDGATGNLVGGGITDVRTNGVTVNQSNGQPVDAVLVPGGFVVSSSLDIQPGYPVYITVH